jgi:hypothetical protein
MPIEEEIEAVFAGQDVDGDVDVDGVIAAFERLKALATKADLLKLVAAIQSPRNNFWTRELLSEPICRLGGSDYLEPLFEALQLGFDEGHDNDGFQAHVIDIAKTEPKKTRSKLKELMGQKKYAHKDLAKWLLEFCKNKELNGMA